MVGGMDSNHRSGTVDSEVAPLTPFAYSVLRFYSSPNTQGGWVTNWVTSFGSQILSIRITMLASMKALVTLLNANRAQVDAFSIEQIVALCGNGKLADNSETCVELRDYLQIAQSENLFKYLETCLRAGFDKSGMVLQDIVNEFGRRLDYNVENGLYQGRSNAIGYDGLWTAPNGRIIVVEVKTTDAYRINLDTIAGYREQLIKSGKISRESSVLLVVGRQDTGDLEAQVRGSQHAWSFRIISAEALAKLVKLKENAELASISKIHDLLMPFEYTRLDKIIEIAFTVAEDATHAAESVHSELEDVAPEAGKPASAAQDRLPYSPTPTEIVTQIRNRIISALAPKYAPFIKNSRALYWTADKSVRLAITISKEYEKGNYWYAYHPDWDAFLTEGTTGLFVLGCVGRNKAYAIPLVWIHSRLDRLNVTERYGGRHYHIHLHPDSAGKLLMRLNNGQNENIDSFELPL